MSDKGKKGWYIQPVNNDWRVNPGHVFVALGKDILVLSLECREFLMDRWASEGVDFGCLLRFGVFVEYLFQPFNGLCNCLLFLYAYGL